MRLPQFRRYAVTTDVTFPGGTDAQGKVHPAFQISNHNTLLANYPGAIGVKNGYTSGARHTFIGAATRGGRTLLITEMGGVVVPSWQPTAALLDWAFAHARALTPVGTLVAPGAPQPPEWRVAGALPSRGSASGSSLTASAGTSGANGTTGGSAAGTPSTEAAPVVASGPGGDPLPGVLASARTAAGSPAAYGVVLVLLTALAGLLLTRRRRSRAPT